VSKNDEEGLEYQQYKTATGNILNLNKQKQKIVIRIKSSVVKSKKLKKLKEIPVSDIAMSKESTLTQSYELPLNAFQRSGVSRCYGIPYS